MAQHLGFDFHLDFQLEVPLKHEYCTPTESVAQHGKQQ